MMEKQEIMDLNQTLALCASVCEDCAAVGFSRIQYGTLKKWWPTDRDYAEVCSGYDQEHCRICAKVCLKCADICRSYYQKLNH